MILSRRDVREFEPRPIADDELDQILEAGRRSPSSQNWQPWTFVAVTGSEALGRLSGVWKGASHVRSSAATIALVAEPQGSAAEIRSVAALRPLVVQRFGQRMTGRTGP